MRSWYLFFLAIIFGAVSILTITTAYFFSAHISTALSQPLARLSAASKEIATGDFHQEIELTSTFDVYSGNDDPRTNAVLILYLGRSVGGSLKAGDDAKDVQFFPFSELPENIAFISHRQALADYTRRYRGKTP